MAVSRSCGGRHPNLTRSVSRSHHGMAGFWKVLLPLPHVLPEPEGAATEHADRKRPAVSLCSTHRFPAHAVDLLWFLSLLTAPPPPSTHMNSSSVRAGTSVCFIHCSIPVRVQSLFVKKKSRAIETESRGCEHCFCFPTHVGGADLLSHLLIKHGAAPCVTCRKSVKRRAVLTVVHEGLWPQEPRAFAWDLLDPDTRWALHVVPWGGGEEERSPRRGP